MDASRRQAYEIHPAGGASQARAAPQGNGTIGPSCGRLLTVTRARHESQISEDPSQVENVATSGHPHDLFADLGAIVRLWHRVGDVVSACLPGRYRQLPQQVAATSGHVEQLSAHVQRLTEELGHQRAAVDRGYQGLLEQLAEMSRLRGEDRAELTSLAARTRTNEVTEPEATADGNGNVPAGQPDLDSFYSGFEERFRGNRDAIEAKLVEYLPAVRGAERGDAAVLDVGPGRCEWLELLSKHGIRAYGVDTNARFVELGNSLGLDVRFGDGIAHLRELPDQSLAGVTAFQVAEHLPTNLLFDLVDHALRTLRPGGVLILETPNPLNLLVGAAEFWIDPTHVHPLHPQFLEYLLISRGFVDVEVRMANPPNGSFDLDRLGAGGDELRRLGNQLNDLLFGGRDYAVIGRRAASPG